jgi:hypothetical protein
MADYFGAESPDRLCRRVRVDIAEDEPGSRRDILLLTRRQVVDDENLVSRLYIGIGDGRSDESGTPGQQYFQESPPLGEVCATRLLMP